MTQTLEKAVINKLKKSTYDTNVESGVITPQMIKEEAWLFTDDQFVSASDVTNWNNKANMGDVPTKTSELINDAHFITEANIPTKTSDLINDSNFVTSSEVPTKTSDLINDSGFVNADEVPEKTSDLINDSGFITSNDLPTRVSELSNDAGYITNTVNNLVNYTLATNTGSQIGVTINPTTYEMIVSLLNSSGAQIDSASVDLPLESMVVGATYDSVNKAIVLTLQSGETISVPVADLVDGLQEEITVDNKLASDLVDDTNQTNKFVTTSEKSTWNAKYDKPGTGIPKTDLSSEVQTSLGLADTAIQTETDPVFTNSPAYGITSQDITDWNNKSDFSGNYSDLVGAPTALSDFTNDENFISDANYVHTDNNYTTADKNKLSGIESGAEVNTIETIKVNGTALVPDQDRAVDITVAGSADNISYDNTTSGLTADDVQEAIDELANEKVDKVAGKGLSTEDFTTAEQTKLSNIEAGAEVNDIDTIKVNGATQTITNKTVDITVPTTTSELTNDSGFIDKDVNDLTNYTKTSDLPTVNDATLTIQKNSTSVGTFTANASANKTINITVPTAMSDLTNDNNTVTDANYVHTDNNFTTAEKTKLSGIESGAEVNDIETIKVNGTTQTITNKTVDITIPAADEYTLEEVTTTAGYAKSYQLKKNSTYIGDKIDIPSDLVVESGEVKTVTTPDVPYQGAVPGDKYIDLTLNDPNEDHIYIPVNDLVDAYSAGNGIAISNANVVSVELDNNNTNGLSVSSNGLALSTATTSTPGAMSSTDKTKLNGIESGAQVNVIESVVVNGTTATVANKTASVTIQTGAIDTISVNGVTQPIDINKNVDITVPTTADEISYRIGYSDTWYSKTWTGLTNFYGSDIWTDGENVYHSYRDSQYVLDKSTGTWQPKVWNGIESFQNKFYGNNIWTDGENIYYSADTHTHYVLDKATSTWSAKTWNGVTAFTGSDIWTDGENIYYSYASDQYVLDKSTNTWSDKTWNGNNYFEGARVWTDGENIYLSTGSSSRQYILDKATSTWVAKTWSGLTTFYGEHIWTDGENIYYSYNSNQYILNKATSTWVAKTWSGLTNPDGKYIWTDKENMYYSSYSSNRYVHYILGVEETTVQNAIDNLDSSITTYTAGNGINISNTNEISAKINNSNANGLSVDSNGLALSTATTSTSGAMSSTDKTKLEGIESGAEVNDINSISVNGTALTPDVNKNVDITISGALKILPLATYPADPRSGIPTYGDVTIEHLESGTYLVDASAYSDLVDDPDYEIYLSYTTKFRTNTGGTTESSYVELQDGDIVFIERTGTVSQSTLDSNVPSCYAEGERFSILSISGLAKYKLSMSAGTTYTTCTWTKEADAVHAVYPTTVAALNNFYQYFKGAASHMVMKDLTINYTDYKTNLSTSITFPKGTFVQGDVDDQLSGMLSIANHVRFILPDGTIYRLDYITLTATTLTFTKINTANPFVLTALSDTAPATCAVGDIYVNTTDNTVYECNSTDTWSIGYPATVGEYIIKNGSDITKYYFNGVSFIQENTGGGGGSSAGDIAPLGTIREVSWNDPSYLPAGWMFCHHQALSRNTYSDLFARIGISYGSGDGSTTFNLPDKEGLIGVGYKSGDSDFGTMGKTGGSKYMQKHSHTRGTMNITGTFRFQDDADNAGIDAAGSGTGAISGINGSGSGSGVAGTTWQVNKGFDFNAANNWTGATSEEGTGTSGNLQPYVVVEYIIKVENVTTPAALSDNVPIGTIVDYDGNTVPDGYVQVSDYTIPAATQSTLGGVKIYVANGNLYINTE